MTLLVFYGYNDDYDGSLVALNIKFSVCSFGGYGSGVCDFLV